MKKRKIQKKKGIKGRIKSALKKLQANTDKHGTTGSKN
jgi:hypothetical protein